MIFKWYKSLKLKLCSLYYIHEHSHQLEGMRREYDGTNTSKSNMLEAEQFVPGGARLKGYR